MTAMKKIGKLLRKYIYKADEDYVTIHAAYSALFMFMSIFPLFMFILSILTRLNVSRDYLLEQLYNLTPTVFHSFIEDIVRSIEESSTTFVVSISLIVAIWSASSGVYGLLLGLNDVYRTYDTRSYFRQRAISILYMFIIVIAVSASLFITNWPKGLP